MYNRQHTPAMDVFASDNTWMLQLDMPGVSRSDIDLQVDAGLLTISSREGDDTPPRWFRRMTLPKDANVNSITAELTDGVLSVTVPVDQPVVRQIAIG